MRDMNMMIAKGMPMRHLLAMSHDSSNSSGLLGVVDDRDSFWNPDGGNIVSSFGVTSLVSC